MRQEAQKIFFESNQWGLNIHLVRIYPGLDRLSSEKYTAAGERGWERGPAVTSTRLNTASLIEEHWGEEALLRMRDVRIDVLGQYKDAHADTKAALKELVEKLKGRNMRKLVITWNNWYGIVGGKCGTGRKKAGDEIRRAMRNEDGTRLEPRHRRITGWEKTEGVLEPLLELRGLGEVRVMGCVTNQWATHLENSISSKKKIPRFK